MRKFHDSIRVICLAGAALMSCITLASCTTTDSSPTAEPDERAPVSSSPAGSTPSTSPILPPPPSSPPESTEASLDSPDSIETSTNSANPEDSIRTYQGTAVDVAFGFDYPSKWTVQWDGPETASANPIRVSNENGDVVASLLILPYLSVEPCYAGCADFPVLDINQIHSNGTLNGQVFFVSTVAMDLTGQIAKQEKYQWADNVQILVGVSRAEAPPDQQDPMHFTLRASIEVDDATSSLRPIHFSTSRFFSTIEEASNYTASTEYTELQEMFASFWAQPSLESNDPSADGTPG